MKFYDAMKLLVPICYVHQYQCNSSVQSLAASRVVLYNKV